MNNALLFLVGGFRGKGFGRTGTIGGQSSVVGRERIAQGAFRTVIRGLQGAHLVGGGVQVVPAVVVVALGVVGRGHGIIIIGLGLVVALQGLVVGVLGLLGLAGQALLSALDLLFQVLGVQRADHIAGLHGVAHLNVHGFHGVLQVGGHGGNVGALHGAGGAHRVFQRGFLQGGGAHKAHGAALRGAPLGQEAQQDGSGQRQNHQKRGEFFVLLEPAAQAAEECTQPAGLLCVGFVHGEKLLPLFWAGWPAMCGISASILPDGCVRFGGGL